MYNQTQCGGGVNVDRQVEYNILASYLKAAYLVTDNLSPRCPLPRPPHVVFLNSTFGTDTPTRYIPCKRVFFYLSINRGQGRGELRNAKYRYLIESTIFSYALIALSITSTFKKERTTIRLSRIGGIHYPYDQKRLRFDYRGRLTWLATSRQVGECASRRWHRRLVY